MIKVLLLIFDPVRTWEGVVAARRSRTALLLGYFLPLLVLVSVIEGYGLIHVHRARGQMGRIETLSVPQMVFYEVAQFALAILVLFILAYLIKALGETFHGRHTFTQTFTVATYGLAPVLLLRLLDIVPGMSPWLGWAVGGALAGVVLYHGLPRVMLPDPPQAFGLFLMSALLLAFVTGLVRFVTAWYLQGRLTKLDAIISRFAHGH